MTPLIPGERTWRLIRAEWERSLASLLVAAAAVLFAVAFRRLATTAYAPEEIAYLVSGGCGSLLLMILAVWLQLSAALADHEHKLAGIERTLSGRPGCDAQTSLARLRAGDLGWAEDGDWKVDWPTRRPTPFGCGSKGSVVVVAVSLTLVILGWLIASRATDLDSAITGLVVGVLGLVVSGTALGLITVVRRSHVVSRQRSLGSRLASIGAGAPVLPHGGDDGRWTAPGLTRFHRASCPALTTGTGEATVVVLRGDALEPCLLCQANGV